MHQQIARLPALQQPQYSPVEEAYPHHILVEAHQEVDLAVLLMSEAAFLVLSCLV